MSSCSFDPNALGSAELFEELLHLLKSADYSDSFICRRFHLERPEDLELDRKRRDPLPEPESAADILMQLFLAGDTVSESTANRFLGAQNFGLLERMNLLTAGAKFNRILRHSRVIPGRGHLYSLRSLEHSRRLKAPDP